MSFSPAEKDPSNEKENKGSTRLSVFLFVASVFVIGFVRDADQLRQRQAYLTDYTKDYVRSISIIGKLKNASNLWEKKTGSDQVYEITTTNFGWTTPADLNFSRRILSGEFFNATVAHPRYNATAWADLEEHPDPSRTIVAFMDVDTCLDFLYPIYVTRTWWFNTETWGGRTSGGGVMHPVINSCQYIRRAAESPTLTANPRSRLVILNCHGFYRDSLKSICQRRDSAFQKDIVMNDQVVFASYSEVKAGSRPNVDVGLPPPAIKPVTLTDRECQAIQKCEQRKYLFAFQGRKDHGRERYLDLEPAEDVYIHVTGQQEYKDDLNEVGSDRHNYTQLLRNTMFGAAPIGDALYSYRFVETMSAGAIPVVNTNLWLPPFNEHVVQWENCAVFVADKDFNKTIDILRAIPASRVCKMQQCVLEVWNKYLSNRSGWVRGLVKAALAQSNITMDGA